MITFYRFVPCRKNISKKKTKETVKQELLNSLMENDEIEEQGFEEIANIITNLARAIRLSPCANYHDTK